MSSPITAVLDSVEQRLPPIPRALFRFNRAATKAATATLCQTMGASRTAADAVRSRGATGAKTVAGQAEAASERVAESVVRGGKEVAGQAEAQASATIEEAQDRTVSLIEDLGPTAEASPAAAVPYEDWTKADLYRRAQELDVPGRSSLSKAALIAALRSRD